MDKPTTLVATVVSILLLFAAAGFGTGAPTGSAAQGQAARGGATPDAPAAADAPEKDAPEAVFPETRHAFDAVLDGQIVTHAYRLQNKGNAALEVVKVRTG
jgi:hypothetical protein